MKILVTIYQMQEGGAARVTSTMINGLAEKGYNVVLCTDSVYYHVFYPVSEIIRIKSYNSKPKKLNKYIHLSKAVLRIRDIIKTEKPDIVVGVESIFYFLTKIACTGIRIPVVAVDHTSMGNDLGFFTNWIRHTFYKTSSSLSILTHKDFAILGNKLTQKRVIYNPIPFPPLDKRTNRKKNILCVGRLNAWKIKGFDIMLDIWKSISIFYPDWILDIAGDGNKESFEKIQTMIQDRDLNDRVRLLGQIKDICSLYQNTSIFALTSRVEGFPMCLVEAMSQGCACISFKMEGAVSEMIENGVSGIIIDDGDIINFIKEIQSLMSNVNKQKALGIQAIERSKVFSKEAFIQNWESLFQNVIHNS